MKTQKTKPKPKEINKSDFFYKKLKNFTVHTPLPSSPHTYPKVKRVSFS